VNAPLEMIEGSLTVNGGAREAQRVGAPQPRRFPEIRARAHRHHVGCEHGVCGACTVRVDGEIVARLPDVRRAGRRLQGWTRSRAFRHARDRGAAKRVRLTNALQCGFCTPGVLMAAQALLRDQPNPSRERIREYLSGQLLPLHRLPGDRRCDRSVWPRLAPPGAVDERIRRNGEDAPLRRAQQLRRALRDAPNARRLTQGRGQYVDDIVLRAWCTWRTCARSHAHREIVKIESKRPRPCRAWCASRPAPRSPWCASPMSECSLTCTECALRRNTPLGRSRSRRGQASRCVAVVAQSRAEAEDAVDAVEVRYEELPPRSTRSARLDPSEPKIHKESTSTCVFQLNGRHRRRRCGDEKPRTSWSRTRSASAATPASPWSRAAIPPTTTAPRRA